MALLLTCAGLLALGAVATALAAPGRGRVAPVGGDVLPRPVGVAVTFLALAVVVGFLSAPSGSGGRSRFVLIAALAAAAPLALALYVVPAELRRRRLGAGPGFPELLPLAVPVALALGVLAWFADPVAGFTFPLIAACLPYAARGLTDHQEGGAVLRGSLVLLVASLAAWGARAFLPHGGIVAAFVEVTLTQLFVAGVVGLVICLLPVPPLDGHALWSSAPRLWALVYTGPLLLLVLALAAPEDARRGEAGGVLVRGAIAVGVLTAGALAVVLAGRARRREEAMV